MLRVLDSGDNLALSRIREVQAGTARADRKEIYRIEDQFHCDRIFSCNVGSSNSAGAFA